jgi:hypothetical protein
MEYVNYNLVTHEILAKHHTKVTTYWHGTHSGNLDSILHNGLIPNKDSIYEHSFEAIGGVYLSTDIRKAYLSAEQAIAMQHYNYKKVLVACHITDKEDLSIDEDDILVLIRYSKLLGSMREDISSAKKKIEGIAAYNWILTDKFYLDKFLIALNLKFIHNKSQKIAFERFSNDKNLARWFYLCVLNLEKLLESTETKHLRDEFRSLSKEMLNKLGKFAYKLIEDDHGNIFFNSSLGYKGKNRIVAIYEEIEYEKDINPGDSPIKELPFLREDLFKVCYQSNSINSSNLDNKLEKALSNYKIRVVHKE